MHRLYGAVDASGNVTVDAATTAESTTSHPNENNLTKFLAFSGVGTTILFAGALFVSLTRTSKPVESDLWNELSDPSKLLEYVAHEMSADIVMDDDLFYPLTCTLYDDDTVFPNDVCESGDNATCHSDSMTTAYMETCGHACEDGWGVPCGWEAVASLPQVCDESFKTSFPNKSTNALPDHMQMKTLTVNSTGKSFWACNVHAFCYSCVSDTGLVNDFCKAAVIRTKSLYAPAAVFEYLTSYWCDVAIINEIQNGSFCGYAADKMKYCEKYGEFARL